MTLASFIDYLKAIPVTEVTSEKADLLPEKQRHLIDSIGEDGPGNKVTEVTSKNNEGATEKREFSEFAPVWVAPAPAPPPQPVALPVPVTPPAPETWRQHDKADQAHYWACVQCKAVVVQRQPGDRCPEGQRLSDAYIEAATREGRFIGARVPRKRQNQ